MLIEISGATDPRLRDYLSLRDVQLRRSVEATNGLFIAEGAQIIRRAAQAGCQPRSFLLASRWLPSLADVIDCFPEVPVYEVSEQLAEQVTGFHVHRGALGSFVRPEPTPFDEVLDLRRLVVCEDIVDHTNLGAIIRCAAGLGWEGVIVTSTGADPLYRRAIKTSMGTVFSLPWVRMSEGIDGLDRLKEAGFTLAAMALSNNAIPLAQYRPPHKLALLMGTEGAGLSPTWLGRADVTLTVPMSRGVDSLNVAAATGIACYALG